MTEAPFMRQPVDEPHLARVLAEAVGALDDADLPYVCVGGIASALLGRGRRTLDVDLLVHPADAKRALAVLGDEGFDTQETNEVWLHKALKEDVLVDVIFRSEGNITLDDPMLARSTERDFRGTRLRVVGPEDLAVMLALAASEETPHYWHNALGVIANCDLDWDYLLERARHGARRVLSLLVYAESVDLLVSPIAVRQLVDRIYPNAAIDAELGSA